MIKKEIILASSSPRRRELLKSLGIRFKAVKSYVDEELLVKEYKKYGFEKLVKILSLAKVLSALCKIDKRKAGKIFGFDTIVVCNKKILGKPKNKKDALRMLLSLSGKQHMVYTGIAMIDLKKKTILFDFGLTKVLMNKITKEQALNYIKTKEPMDKAGAYAIQGIGKKFVKKIIGDYYNVVGLPVNKFMKMLGNR